MIRTRKPEPRDLDYAESVMVPGDGPTPCRVMFVGMRPGKDEPWHRPRPRPFVGMAGQELDRYLLMAGLRREQVYVTNLVKNWVRDDKEPEPWEVARDEDTLVDEISEVGPDVIIPLGAFATRYFLGEWATMEVVHGLAHRADDSRVERSFAATVFPIYHPAAGLHDPESIQYLVYDFDRLRSLLWGADDESGDVHVPTDTHPHPDYSVIDGGDGDNSVGGTGPDRDGIWHHKYQSLAIDTEGWRDDPICIQFARYPGEGRLIYADQRALLERLQHLIRVHEGPILLHNSLHDLDVCRALGVEIPEGRYYDTMVWAYLLCLEPQGLKALSYRINGRLRRDYDEVVGPANSHKAYDYLRLLDQYEWGAAEPYVITEIVNGSLVPKIKKPHNLGRRISRILKDHEGKIGGIDIRKRWSNLVSDNPQLVAKVHELVGPMPVATLRDVPEKERVEYACADADDTIRIAPVLAQRVHAMGLDQVSAIDHAIIPMVDRMQRIGIAASRDHFVALGERMAAEMETIQGKIHEQTGAWINPDSGDQCADLLFTQLRLPWSKLTKSKSRPKCDDKVLEGLRGAHPAVSSITDYRERSKIKSSFCGPIVAILDQGGDRIHCNLRITRVSSGRLAASGPNLLAIPVRSDLGLEVRRGFHAGPGRVLAEWDLDQIEMREMSHQSQEPRLLAVFREGRDVHSETGSLVFGRPPKDVTKFQRYASKRVGFGVITGITGLGLLDQIQMALALLPSEERAKQESWDEVKCDQLIETWFNAYPRVRAFMEDCRCEARRYSYVRDRWGRIRYLPGIHSRIAKVRAEAERQSHSFKISASAQGIMKRGMALVWSEVVKGMWGVGVWVEPILQVHDSLLLEHDTDAWEAIDIGMRDCLSNRADPTFSVPIKAKGGGGKTWADLEK